MRSSHRITTALLTLCLLLGCDGGDDKAPPGAKANSGGVADSASADAEAEAKDEVDAATSPKDDDKGTAELTLGDGGETWKAKRASARIKDDGKLRITASVQSISEDTTSRRQLTLNLANYEGPGKYVITDMMSNLTAVSLDFGATKKAEAEGDEAKANDAAKKAALDGIQGGSVLLLKDAKVEITKADGDFIDGTIVWTGISTSGTNKLSGTFHARVKS